MIMSSRGSMTTARSIIKWECTCWLEGVWRWANMVKSSEGMLARQERASTTSITFVIIAKGAAERANAVIVACNSPNCKVTKSTHSANVVTKHSARLFLPQHSSVAGYLNMPGTATVAFLAVLIATGSSATIIKRSPLSNRYTCVPYGHTLDFLYTM